MKKLLSCILIAVLLATTLIPAFAAQTDDPAAESVRADLPTQIVFVNGIGQLWSHLIDGITPPVHPKVVSEKVTGTKDNPTAELTVNIDGENRMIYMRKEDGRWKINLNVAINPRKITLPDNVPVEYLENFEVSDEPDAWWEEGVAEKKDEKDSKDGFFGGLKKKLFK